MPETHRAKLSMRDDQLELFKKYFDEHKEELKLKRIYNPTALFLECALRGLEDMRDQLEGKK
jgi:hypothetical protein